MHALLGEVELNQGHGARALEQFIKARELGMNQVPVEVGYAVALHLSGAPVAECIAAYRTAIALSPTNAGLKLNMAQLLFAAGRQPEAARMLFQAQEIGLQDAAKLEAMFYRLAHTDADIHATMEAIRELLIRGIRMNWNMDVTVASVAENSAGPRAYVLGSNAYRGSRATGGRPAAIIA